MMHQQYPYVVKKYVFDILQERYSAYEEVLSRVTYHMTTEKDVREFCQMVADSYSKGYEKAVQDYKVKLRELGYEVAIVSGHSNAG